MAKHAKPKHTNQQPAPAVSPASEPTAARPSQTMSSADKYFILTARDLPSLENATAGATMPAQAPVKPTPEPVADKPVEPTESDEPVEPAEPDKPAESVESDEPTPVISPDADAAAFPESEPDETDEPPKKRLWLILLLAALLLIGGAVWWLFAAGGLSGQPAHTGVVSDVSAEPSDEPSDVSEEAVAPAKDRLPMEVRGVVLTPGVDIAVGDEVTADSLGQEVSDAFDEIDAWSFNTVLLPVNPDGDPLKADVIGAVLDAARAQEVTVMAVLDCGVQNGTLDPADPASEATLTALAKQIAAYGFDGYLLCGFAYAEDTDALLNAFKKQTAAGSLADYAETRVTERVTAAMQTIRRTHKGAVVGLLCDPVWNNATTDEAGSDTAADYESGATGHANLPAWIKQGLPDVVFVDADTRLDDDAVPFSEVLSWWNGAVADTDVWLYTVHAADRMGTGAWNSPDELALQWSACAETEQWRGGVFRSLAALIENRDDCASVLKSTLQGSIDLSDLAKKLTFTEPESAEVTTGESSFTFRGTADPHFPLLMNGKEVERSEHGLFAVDAKLKAGDNTFTFEHKGKKVTYTVTYEIDVLKSVSPQKDLNLSGGTSISVSAIAHKNATVSATIGGVNVPMKLAPIKADTDDGDADSDYVNFSGEYTLPDSVAGRSQDLGYITVFASYNGLSRALQGGRITVKPALEPEPEEPDEPEETTTTPAPTTTTVKTAPPTTVTTQTTATEPSGDTSDTTRPTTVTTQTTATTTTTVKTTTTTATKPTVVNPDAGKVLATGTIMKITEDYAETFNNAVEDYSRPTNAYLPESTLDVLVKEVYDSASGNSYYLLGYGKRVYTDAAKVVKSSGSLTANAAVASGTSVTGDATTLTLTADWHVPYSLQLKPQDYPYIGTMGTFGPEYDITSFTASYVDITFAYTTATAGSFDVSGSPIFSKATFIKNSNNTCTLRLNLKKTGGFYGYSVSWESGNRLVFRFRHAAPANGSSTPLSGMTIVVDAGHGGEWSGTYGAIEGLYEKTLTLQYALELQKQLEALGANVVMSRTTDVKVEMHDVTALTRRVQADLFISIHMDGVSSPSANGPSAHYFTEYSYAFAKAIADKMYGTYASYKTTTKRGARWDPFYVTRISDCPAVLLECGFMTNIDDLELLINDSFRKKLCAAIADGTVAYAKSIG